jgi:hypothetical protein
VAPLERNRAAAAPFAAQAMFSEATPPYDRGAGVFLANFSVASDAHGRRRYGSTHPGATKRPCSGSTEDMTMHMRHAVLALLLGLTAAACGPVTIGPVDHSCHNTACK